MDRRIAALDIVKKCENFANNALDRGRPDLAAGARLRSLEIRAETRGAKSEAEREALQAVYAYEDVLTSKNASTTRASRTWKMIKRYGIIEAVERAVKRPTVTQGCTMLAEMGLEEYAFEAVILRQPSVFSDEADEISRQRLGDCAK